MAAPDSSRAPPRGGDPDATQVRGGPGRSVRIQFDSPDDLIGHTLNDRYKILEQLGSGGMGTVYLAEHVLINKRVAIKVLSPSHARKPDEVERFLREARAASRIRQQNVVDITDFGYTSGGLAFLVMEHLEGEDLATTSNRDGALPWRRAVHITRQICAALEAAHTQGVIHRDMKPENVFRVRRGDDPDFIKVLDFGIAKIIDEYGTEQPSNTNSGLMGTPEYVAPELIRGLPPDARVDIYAVGVILYRLLTGRVPFAGESFMATLTQHLMEEVRSTREAAPDREIPESLDAICLKSLAKDRDQRYATIGEMHQALAAIEANARPVMIVSQDPPRRGLPLLLALVGVIVVAAVVLWAYAAGRESVPEVVAVAPPAPVPEPKDMSSKTGPKVQVVTPVPEPVPVPEPAPVPPVEPGEAPDLVGEDPEVGGDEEDAKGKSKRPGVRAPLPDRLTSIELAGGMSKLAARVKTECSGYAMRNMAVGLRVEVGANGKVKSATPMGLQSGALGGCVAKVAKTAKYRAARDGAEFEYTFRM
ncbi:serine/threonine-protein kinase [Nannocystis sp.]|uniref:serine/threonine protein kinase n=1 Tax=Nannocystis sp. TaxID=1962667 RepID=UPI002421BDB9|nr:serine/threonine-protein kinase [Nannocystis sp.]MBK7824898.1 serine/threonine protein kinase [Nannocystis sp.]MBK9752848.1 serine/threonine protein kinase [Nannocystis sp.]